MGLLSTVNGRRPGEPRPGYYLFALRLGETPGRWARELDSTTSWVGTPPAMRCRTQWGAETSSVPIHQFGWSVECGGSKGNGIVVPLEPFSPSSILTRLCAPTRCQVRCRVSPQKTVCMEKIADLKDRPGPDGNGNSRKQSPKRRPKKLRARAHHKETSQKPNTFLACRVLLAIIIVETTTHAQRAQRDHGWGLQSPPASASGGYTTCRLQLAGGCSDSTGAVSRPPPLANVPGARSDRPPRLTPGPGFVSGIGRQDHAVDSHEPLWPVLHAPRVYPTPPHPNAPDDMSASSPLQPASEGIQS